MTLQSNDIKSEPLSNDEILQNIKNEPVDGDDTKNIENLYTSKGLQASLSDLEQLFDEENSSSSPLGVSFCFLSRKNSFNCFDVFALYRFKCTHHLDRINLWVD